VVEAQIRRAQGSLDRFFHAFEEGSSRGRPVFAASRSSRRSCRRSRPGALNLPRRYRRVGRPFRTPRSPLNLSATSSGPWGMESCRRARPWCRRWWPRSGS